MDAVSEARLGMIWPVLAAKIRTLAEMLEQESITIRVTQALRSWTEQDGLYQQGRTRPGPIVTNAAAGTSWHNFGMAVDVVPMAQAGQPDWNVEHPAWKRLIAAGESLGLFSGSEFRTFKDYPHFQLTGRFPVSPTDEVRQLFKDAGMEAVWQEAEQV